MNLHSFGSFTRFFYLTSRSHFSHLYSITSHSYDDLDKMVEGSGGIALRNITQLVEHPIPIEPLSDPNKPVVLPVMLTKKERKKMRAQRRKVGL